MIMCGKCKNVLGIDIVDFCPEVESRNTGRLITELIKYYINS